MRNPLSAQGQKNSSSVKRDDQIIQKSAECSRSGESTHFTIRRMTIHLTNAPGQE
jgi:hypothetical protein